MRTLPTRGEHCPHEENIAPHEESVAPHEENAAPHEENVAPHEENAAPHEENAAPYKRNTAPHDGSAAPHDPTYLFQHRRDEESTAPHELCVNAPGIGICGEPVGRGVHLELNLQNWM